MNDLPPGTDIQALMAQLEAEERPQLNWIWPIAVTIVLDVVGLAALWAGYSSSAGSEGLLASRALALAALSQPGAFVIAQKTRQPWLLPAWALVFAMSGVFMAVLSYATADPAGV